MLTVRELLQRLLKPGKTEELAEAMLSQLSSDLFEKNSLRFNLPMLVVRFLFMSAILLPQITYAPLAYQQSERGDHPLVALHPEGASDGS